jgi:hypothetical protein
MIALGIILAALFVIAIVIYLIYKASQAEQKVEAATPKVFKPSEFTAAYGHTFNPLVAVKNRLPKAPEGYMWELYITNSKKNMSRSYQTKHLGQILVLNLYSNALSSVVASEEVSITWYAPHGNTFEEHYKNFGSFGMAKSDAYDEIVMPMVAWAKDIEQQLSPDKIIGYEAVG